MYRRYSQAGDGSMPLSQIKRNRIKNILIFLLLAGMAAMLVISLPPQPSTILRASLRLPPRSVVTLARIEIGRAHV